jgi:hypothetical protein
MRSWLTTSGVTNGGRRHKVEEIGFCEYIIDQKEKMTTVAICVPSFSGTLQVSLCGSRTQSLRSNLPMKTTRENPSNSDDVIVSIERKRQ